MTLGEIITQAMFGTSENADMYGEQVVRPLVKPANKVALLDMATQLSNQYGVTVHQAKTLIRVTAKLWDTEVP